MPLEPLVFPDLTTQRLTLRRLTPDDVPALFVIFSHPEVMRFWSSLPYKEMSQAKLLLEQILDGYRTQAYFQLGIERNTDQALIGTCTVGHIHKACRRAEIGYALGRSFWGSGYMYEALSALMDHLYTTLNFNRLEADIDPRNLASAKVLEKMGFQKEGFLPERWIVGDEVSDSALYGLLKSDWEQRSSRS